MILWQTILFTWEVTELDTPFLVIQDIQSVYPYPTAAGNTLNPHTTEDRDPVYMRLRTIITCRAGHS